MGLDNNKRICNVKINAKDNKSQLGEILMIEIYLYNGTTKE